MNNQDTLKCRNFEVHVRNGYVRMKDLHRASGEKESKLPTFYVRRRCMKSAVES